MHRGTKFDINQHFYFLILPDSRTNDLIISSFQNTIIYITKKRETKENVIIDKKYIIVHSQKTFKL
jgi:hypothetical protein